MVDQVLPIITTTGAVSKNILKWTLNNGDAERVECIAWNIQIERVQSSIVLGNVMTFMYIVECNNVYGGRSTKFYTKIQLKFFFNALSMYFAQKNMIFKSLHR